MNRTIHETKLKNNSVSLNYYVFKKLQDELCPRNFEFFHHSTKVFFLNDGTLYTDNGMEAAVYNDSFCIDNFYQHPKRDPFVSAFLCNNVTPGWLFQHSLWSEKNKQFFALRNNPQFLLDCSNYRFPLLFAV
jgi:hypothetical protein